MLKNKYFRIGICLVIALAVTFIIFRGAESKGKIEYQKAVIAKDKILQNEKINSENLEVEKVPAQNLPEKTLDKIPEGKIAAVDIHAGQYIIPALLTEKKTVEITSQHRVYPVPVTLETIGWVNKGDMVDVLWSYKEKKEPKSEVIVSGVTVDKILTSTGKRIIQKPGEDEVTREVTPAVAELLVTLDQAEELSKAVTNGTLSLAKYKPESKPVRKGVASENKLSTAQK